VGQIRRFIDCLHRVSYNLRAALHLLQARKLVKELQAHMAAAEAAAALDACMSRRPCGSNALKSAISKADAAASAASGTATTTTAASSAVASSAAGAAAAGAGTAGATSTSCVLSELLVSRLQAAKKRLEVERAAELLHKASVTYKSVADLPKLETAVLNARKVCCRQGWGWQRWEHMAYLTACYCQHMCIGLSNNTCASYALTCSCYVQHCRKVWEVVGLYHYSH
jgi:hypothetical protein